jgi:glycine cleavage system aminomethyltransferase T
VVAAGPAVGAGREGLTGAAGLEVAVAAAVAAAMQTACGSPGEWAG